jgi:hypothetical protein
LIAGSEFYAEISEYIVLKNDYPIALPDIINVASSGRWQGNRTSIWMLRLPISLVIPARAHGR